MSNPLSGWQPIDTAPHNTEVLACWDLRKEASAHRPSPCFYVAAFEQETWWGVESEEEVVPPDFWMHIPASPALAEKPMAPLTDAELLVALVGIDATTKRLPPGFKEFARAIEAAHGINAAPEAPAP